MLETATEESVCGWCRRDLNPNGPSLDFCNQDHQQRWMAGDEPSKPRPAANTAEVVTVERLTNLSVMLTLATAAIASAGRAALRAAREFAKLTLESPDDRL